MKHNEGMKGPAIFLIFLLAATALEVSRGGAEETPLELFEAVSPPASVDASAMPSGLVVRQRFVRVGFDQVRPGRSFVSVLQMNLFADVNVRAVLETVAEGPAGSYGWVGHRDGNENDRIAMVVSGSRLGGTVKVDGRYFQIRPAGMERHVIREVDKAKLPGPVNIFSDMDPFELDVVTLVNQERAIVGLHGLNADNQLSAAAKGHSTEMAGHDYVSHISLDGREFTDRIEAAGYPCDACGENVAGGGTYSTPELVMNGWMASPSHRENILRENFCDIGVGYVYNPDSTLEHFWTQNFGRRTGVDVCPPLNVTDDDSSRGGGCFIGAVPEGATEN